MAEMTQLFRVVDCDDDRERERFDVCSGESNSCESQVEPGVRQSSTGPPTQERCSLPPSCLLFFGGFYFEGFGFIE